MVLRRIDPLSLAKVAGVLYAVIGVLAGLFFAITGLFGALFGRGEVWGSIFGIAAVVVLPVFYGGLGFIMSFLGAALYNVIAERIGGVELDVG
jgi:hypothetical protein